ncbi:MAG: hypothetical protein MUP85_23085, partial [Candidatus Lokiarchaeota archaeon]|nr:hypothetical protein [Candidatus Lokiarchaeota archaeon]
MLKLKIILFALILSLSTAFAQEQDITFEIYLIDAYATPELPHTFVLSFFTSEAAIAKVILENKYEYEISTEFSEMHNISIDLSSLKFENKTVKFVIEYADSLGNKYSNDEYDFDLPFEPKIKSGSSLLTFCLFGGMIFALPAPGYVHNKGEDYFSLTKEIPILSFRSRSFNYPSGYISIEYTYIFNADSKSFFRAGYKKIYETRFLKYISPGISAYTDFKGRNGLAPEISVGWFTLF